MKSGLEGRNNLLLPEVGQGRVCGLNEVRPGRPEQCATRGGSKTPCQSRLNEVRPGRPEQ